MASVKLKVNVVGEGAPLLAIHGVLGSGDNLKVLSQLPLQVHLPDLRNHGDSPNHQDASLAAMTKDLLAYLDEQKMDRVHLFGHSLGARLAMYFAVNFPERVDKLIAVDMAPREYPPKQRPLLDLMEKVELAKVTTRQQADDILKEHVEETFVRQFLLKSLQRKPSGEFGWKVGWRFLRDDYPSWGCSPVTDEQIYSGEGAFMYGMDSTFVSIEDHPIIRKHFPALEIIGIEKAGHWVHSDQPQRFLQEVKRILTVK
jgi:pimeloyl-ACP methyl ester carboxylesterase